MRRHDFYFLTITVCNLKKSSIQVYQMLAYCLDRQQAGYDFLFITFLLPFSLDSRKHASLYSFLLLGSLLNAARGLSTWSLTSILTGNELFLIFYSSSRQTDQTDFSSCRVSPQLAGIGGHGRHFGPSRMERSDAYRRPHQPSFFFRRISEALESSVPGPHLLPPPAQ